MIVSRDNERLKLIRKLHARRWREKLGLFFVEGEDAIAAATAEPVDLLRAGVDVEPRLLAEVSTAGYPPRVIGVYRRADLPAAEARPLVLALWQVAMQGTTPIGGPAIGWIIGISDPRIGLAVGGVACFAAAIGGAALARGYRRSRPPQEAVPEVGAAPAPVAARP